MRGLWTRQFSNHKSRLLSWSHTFAIIVRLDLTPYLLRWYVQIYPRIIISKSHEYTLLTIFQTELYPKGKWPLDDLWTHICWCLMCDSNQGSLYPTHTSKYVDTVTIFQKLNQKVSDPKMTFDPTSVEVICVTLPKDHQVPWKYIKVSWWIQWLFFKNFWPKGQWPRWPLTPFLLRSHVQLYRRIIVFNSHKNTSKHVDTGTLWPWLLLRSLVWLYPRIIVSMSHGNRSMYVDTVIYLGKL